MVSGTGITLSGNYGTYKTPKGGKPWARFRRRVVTFPAPVDVPTGIRGVCRHKRMLPGQWPVELRTVQPMNHRAKSPTPGLRPAFAGTASQRSTTKGLGPKRAAQSTAPVSLETVMVEVLGKIEILLGQAQARIAAHDAARLPRGGNLAPLPSLTSAFATRREIFGAFDGEDVDG